MQKLTIVHLYIYICTFIFTIVQLYIQQELIVKKYMGAGNARPQYLYHVLFVKIKLRLALEERGWSRRKKMFKELPFFLIINKSNNKFSQWELSLYVRTMYTKNAVEWNIQRKVPPFSMPYFEKGNKILDSFPCGRLNVFSFLRAPQINIRTNSSAGVVWLVQLTIFISSQG